MNIAMVSLSAGSPALPADARDGAPSVIVDALRRELSRAGCAVTTFTEGDAATFAARWTSERPDLIHAHSWTSGLAAVNAARPLGIPVVLSLYGLARAKRGRERDPQTAARLDAEAVLRRTASRIIAGSSPEVFALLATGASPGSIKLIPCGIDLALFAPAAMLGRYAGRPFRIATLGSLVPDAGVADVITALRDVAGVELVIGGGMFGADEIAADPDVVRLAAHARACRVADRVRFAGRIARPDVAGFLRSADAVVSVPWYEATGMVALEAMACGVPVIASAVGGHVDVIADAISGVHVAAGNPRQLAYAIEGLATDEPRRARFARFGVERARSRYGWPRIAAEMLDVYLSTTAAGVPLRGVPS